MVDPHCRHRCDENESIWSSLPNQIDEVCYDARGGNTYKRVPSGQGVLNVLIPRAAGCLYGEMNLLTTLFSAVAISSTAGLPHNDVICWNSSLEMHHSLAWTWVRIRSPLGHCTGLHVHCLQLYSLVVATGEKFLRQPGSHPLF